jgi:serine/threonine protein kinase
MCYASAPNDVWSLGVILVNLACGRNPWKRASPEDATFRAYLNDSHFLSSILPISHQLEMILRRIFECDPTKRITLSELRQLILACDSFTSQPEPVYEPPVVVQTYESYESLLTPPQTPPATEPFKLPTDYMDSDSDYDSDNDSVFSRASSISDVDEPSSPQQSTYDNHSNFYCIPPQMDWKKPLYPAAIHCY